jgi:hypothetical protein
MYCHAILFEKQFKHFEDEDNDPKLFPEKK